MDEPQPTFKVVDRRPFNPDGTPREMPPEEEANREVSSAAAATSENIAAAPPGAPTGESASEKSAAPASAAPAGEAAPPTSTARGQAQAPRAGHQEGGDPLDDPASFLSLIMSLASNAASAMGMMPHPMTGETGVDLNTAKHWVDVLGMLEQKTRGNLTQQEEQVVEGLLADLRMQYVSLQNSPSPPLSKFSASDITGGR